MKAKAGSEELVVDGKKLAVSNLRKVLYPATGFTKGEVVNYYVEIAPYLLPHLKGRALTMKRYPDGVEGFFFYEKRCPAFRPKWLRTARVFSERRGENMDYCMADDRPSLVWAANLADIELHPSLALAKAQDRPTSMVFDLDPGEGANIVDCARVALWLREKLAALKLESFIKTSGSKGLQLYVPLNTPITFDVTKPASRQMAESVERDHPEAVVTKMQKALRRKKVLIDWSQNDRHKTTVCVYSLRATREPSVSTPLEWREVDQLLRHRKPERVRFAPDAVLARVKERGDLFAPVLKLKQRLPKP
jgi:bifunctional non-homologous end joining protein LigD